MWLTFLLVNSLHWFSPILRFVQLDGNNFNQIMSFYVIKGWVCVRGLSFALDRLWYGLRAERNTLLEILSFNFYFPLALTGPLVTSVAYKVKSRVKIIFCHFVKCFFFQSHREVNLNVLVFMKRSIKFLMWGLLTESLTYIFYQQTLSSKVKYELSVARNLWVRNLKIF